MRYVKKELVDRSKSGWEMIDEFEYLSSSTRAEFKGGVFVAEYPGDPTTKLFLTIPNSHKNNRADWAVVAPNSKFFPGKHARHLTFRGTFPSKIRQYIGIRQYSVHFQDKANSVANFWMFGRFARHFYSTL
jgi:hypothetical protein